MLTSTLIYFFEIPILLWHISELLAGYVHYTPVRPDGDHPRPYGDQKMYKVAGKREHNARKSLKKYQPKQSCVLTATCAIIPRSQGAPTTTSPRLRRLFWACWKQTPWLGDHWRPQHDVWRFYHVSTTLMATLARSGPSFRRRRHAVRTPPRCDGGIIIQYTYVINSLILQLEISICTMRSLYICYNKFTHFYNICSWVNF